MAMATVPGSRRSLYLPMRDGTRIAIDVWLPSRVQGPLPTVLHQTRYFRSVDYHRVARLMGLPELLDSAGSTRRRFVDAGYAWVDVDARGSGASTGFRVGPWHRDEVDDGVEVVDWIVRQSFSNGTVGATGVSYAGTAAEMLATCGHPAVKAVAPRFSVFDIYADVAFPGGLHLAWFTAAWSRFNQLLDANRFAEAVALMAAINGEALLDAIVPRGRPGAGYPFSPALQGRVRRLISPAAVALLATANARAASAERLVARVVGALARGVEPVDGEGADGGRAALEEAIAAHAANFDVDAGARRLVYRDDVGLSDHEPAASIDDSSPHGSVAQLADAQVAVLGVSGYRDGGYTAAATKRFLSLPAGSNHLLLGPWEHGGRQEIAPFAANRRATFDHDGDLIRFFDVHLRGQGAPPATVRYFTQGEERWRDSTTWPPVGVHGHDLFVASGRRLMLVAPRGEGELWSEIDRDVGSGRRSRWRALLGLAAPVGYGDRSAVGRRMLCLDSPPLATPVTVTGHPVACLWLQVDADDASIFVYLEDVDPAGRVEYVTEGMLRARHRRHRLAPHGHVGPYHSCARADAEAMTPGEVAAVDIALLPISYRFDAGHRLRLAIAGADRDHFAPISATPRTLGVVYGEHHASRLDLPVWGPGPRFLGRGTGRSGDG